MVPQLQFIDILVEFPVVVMRQIPTVRFLSCCTYGAAGSTVGFQRRCAHAATSSSCPVGQFRFSDLRRGILPHFAAFFGLRPAGR